MNPLLGIVGKAMKKKTPDMAKIHELFEEASDKKERPNLSLLVKALACDSLVIVVDGKTDDNGFVDIEDKNLIRTNELIKDILINNKDIKITTLVLRDKGEEDPNVISLNDEVSNIKLMLSDLIVMVDKDGPYIYHSRTLPSGRKVA